MIRIKEPIIDKLDVHIHVYESKAGKEICRVCGHTHVKFNISSTKGKGIFELDSELLNIQLKKIGLGHEQKKIQDSTQTYSINSNYIYSTCKKNNDNNDDKTFNVNQLTKEYLLLFLE